ncbi:MAG: ribonuclease III [Chlamydiales bacterium]|nr:ribonuclease III [Chlamydiales bacterium]
MQKFFRAEEIEKKLAIAFQNPTLLLSAFVHRSFWNENQNLVSGHNERLEFLGDSVLGLLIADYLFLKHPELDEGVLSKLRSQLVDAPACAQYIMHLGISEYLLLGKGEQMNIGKGRDSILADLFEAIIGALYLDQGLEAARAFFFSHFKEDVDRLIASPQRNWKAELQDWTQKNFQETPRYEVVEESGPAHQRLFRVVVWIRSEKRGEGRGSSKKEAQTHAAQDALLQIEERQ